LPRNEKSPLLPPIKQSEEAMADVILQDLKDGLLTITMNRPERKNAMSPEFTLGLLHAAQRAADDPDVRAVLLKGAGGTFCVGGDVRGMADPNRKAPSLEERIVSLRGRMEASRILHEMSKPVVAAIEGAAAGAGLSLALACDLRVVGETAKITTAFAKVGLSGDYGGTYYLTKLIGSAKARELYLLSPILSGKEAHAIGMMTRCVADADVVKAATELATQLARGPTITLGYIKRNINNAEKLSIEACFDGEAAGHSRCSETEDHKEAAAAFVQKRQPVFANR
jgi:2-(1,2-epoxy-1,2-dihydrophenyl)acetyl-CoA isomerase